MRVDIIGRDGFVVTDAILRHAETKVAKLPRFFDAIQAIRVMLGNGKSKNTFFAEITVDVEGHDDFFSGAEGEDLYTTIDAAVQKSSRQLTDHKERLKTHH